MPKRTCIALALLLAACTDRPLDGESATGTSSSGESATGTSTSGESASGTNSTGGPTLPGSTGTTGPNPTTGPDAHTSTEATDSTTADDGCGDFIGCFDQGGPAEECDVWTQDCPEGQKCAPYSGDGDTSWESLQCVDVVPNPAGMYEPCMAGPISTGEDTCDEGLMCWGADPDTGLGRCIGHCIGSPEAPACADPNASCSFGGVLTLCLPRCDPLLQDCFGDEVCIANPGDPGAFVCVLDASGEEGQLFDTCEWANACDPGLFCADPSVAAECDPMAPGCCNPFCDITLPNDCPGAGQECLSWYEEGEAPPEYEHVGHCALPMP